MTTTKEQRTHMYTTRIDIPESLRAKTIELLNDTLAASLDMWSQTKQAHWNVKGKNFYQVHLLFDDIAEVIYPHIDEIAERITSLGGVAHGTVKDSASGTEFKSRLDTFKIGLSYRF